MDAASCVHRRSAFHNHRHCPHHHHHHHCHHHHHHLSPHCHHICPNSAFVLLNAVNPLKPTDPLPNPDVKANFHRSGSAPVDEVLTGQEDHRVLTGREVTNEEPEELDDDDDDPIFVMTDEWKEFFAKSEARRRFEKQQAKNKGKKKQSAP